MTQAALADEVDNLAIVILADPRWEQEDLSVAVFGMLLYGFALAMGRFIMALNIEDIDAAVLQCLTERVGAAAKWSSGLVADANASAFDQAHHPGNYELIGVGHSYLGIKDPVTIADNVFANIGSVRRRVQKPA